MRGWECLQGIASKKGGTTQQCHELSQPQATRKTDRKANLAQTCRGADGFQAVQAGGLRVRYHSCSWSNYPGRARIPGPADRGECRSWFQTTSEAERAREASSWRACQGAAVHFYASVSMTMARLSSFFTDSVGRAPVAIHFLMLGAFRLTSLEMGS